MEAPRFSVVNQSPSSIAGLQPRLPWLNVVSQEVVDIDVESCTADGRFLIEASMGPVPVVLVGPG